MTSQLFSDWPLTRSIETPAEHLHALGVISLLYNQLERRLASIFAEYLGIDSPQCDAIFARLTNKDRSDTLRDLVPIKEGNAATQDRALFAVKCYDICTENRNILSHVIHDSVDATTRDMIATKWKRDTADDVLYRLPLAALRTFADEMARVTEFVNELAAHLFWRRFQQTGYADAPFAPTHVPLPEKPPQPNKLSLLQLPKDHSAD